MTGHDDIMDDTLRVEAAIRADGGQSPGFCDPMENYKDREHRLAAEAEERERMKGPIDWRTR